MEPFAAAAVPGPAMAAPDPTLDLARPAPRRLRAARAYAVALRIAWSYLVFDVLEFALGARWSRWARPRLHARNGRRLRDAVLRLRGLFLKAGQLASVLTGVLPEPFRAPLDALQDRVPAAPFADVEARLRAELGAGPDALFARLDRAPLASASLAQVHRATLHDGREVAVKVQHADIEAVARIDLHAIRQILRAVGAVFGVRGLRQQFHEIEAVVLAELDFEAEARNAAALARAFAAPGGVAETLAPESEAAVPEPAVPEAAVPEAPLPSEPPALRVLPGAGPSGQVAAPTVEPLAAAPAAFVPGGDGAVPPEPAPEPAPARAADPDGPAVAFPRVVPELSRRRVLTTSFEPGAKITDLAQLDAWGLDRTELATRLVDAYARMVFRDGLYHADPHPGNLLVRPDGTIVFLDFGAVGRLTEPMRRGLAEFMLGVLLRDARRVTASLGVMGFTARDPDTAAAVGKLVESVHERVLRGLDPDEFTLSDLTLDWAAAQHADTLGEMADLGVSVRDLASAFEVPRDWILLERTALLCIGVLTTLAPHLNPLQILWPHLRGIAGDAAPSITKAAGATLREAAQTLLALPRRLDHVLGLAERGELTVARGASDDVAAAVTAAGRRLVTVVAAGGSAALALAADALGHGALAAAFGVAAAGLGAVLVGSLAAARRRRLKALRR